MNCSSSKLVIISGILGTALSFSACSKKTPGFVMSGSSSAPPASVLASASLSGELDIFSEGDLVGNPSSFTFRVYKLLLSQNEDCSDPTLVSDYGADGQAFEMTDNPTLFAAGPSNGTYNCIIFQYDDVVRFKSETASTQCLPSREVSHDTYRSDSDPTPWLDPDGNALPSSGTRASPTTDKPYVFIATTAGRAALLTAGYSENQLVTLANSLVIPGRSTLYWDLSNSVFDNGTTCNLSPESSFEFR